jgi:GNAT superfamily N-acetyltransferase
MWTIRQATMDDIDDLTDLRLRFLDEIGYGGDGVSRVVRDYLARTLPVGEFLAWVAEDQERIIAASGLVFNQKPPHGRNRSGKEGFVLNMYTLPDRRGRGIATALMQTIVQFVREQGVTCIRLHASEDGMGIYTKLGFRPDHSEMVLDLRCQATPVSLPGMME